MCSPHGGCGEVLTTEKDKRIAILTAENQRLKSDLNESNDLVEHLGDKRKALTAERDQLKAENEALKAQNAVFRKMPTCWDEVYKQSEELDALREQQLQLVTDAERYRWLREGESGSAQDRMVRVFMRAGLDQEIDAAMKRESRP
jgi:uncharacterized small protein (DUF1192 family)